MKEYFSCDTILTFENFKVSCNYKILENRFGDFFCLKKKNLVVNVKIKGAGFNLSPQLIIISTQLIMTKTESVMKITFFFFFKLSPPINFDEDRKCHENSFFFIFF